MFFKEDEHSQLHVKIPGALKSHLSRKTKSRQNQKLRVLPKAKATGEKKTSASGYVFILKLRSHLLSFLGYWGSWIRYYSLPRYNINMDHQNGQCPVYFFSCESVLQKTQESVQLPALSEQQLGNSKGTPIHCLNVIISKCVERFLPPLSPASFLSVPRNHRWQTRKYSWSYSPSCCGNAAFSFAVTSWWYLQSSLF